MASDFGAGLSDLGAWLPIGFPNGGNLVPKWRKCGRGLRFGGVALRFGFKMAAI